MKKLSKIIALMLAVVIAFSVFSISGFAAEQLILGEEMGVTFGTHKYEVVNTVMDWHEAKEYCESNGGHLVTITSEAENDFVSGLVKKNGTKNVYWIGLHDSVEEGKYTWITGEEFEYAIWKDGKPDNNTDSSHHIGIGDAGEDYVEALMVNDKLQWNDTVSIGVSDEPGYTLEDHGFICEWDDKNDTDNDSEEEMDVIFSGHKYEVINTVMDWHEAKKYCEANGGHLVTITSEAENDFVSGLVKKNGTKNVYWIGLHDSVEEGKYTWITGEEFEYAIWKDGKPDNNTDSSHHIGIGDAGEDYVEALMVNDKLQWNDTVSIGVSDEPGHTLEDHGFICEWDDGHTNKVTLTSIALASAPEKTEYLIGDTLDTTGLAIKAEYSDGTSKIIDAGFTASCAAFTKKGTYAVTVSYTEADITKTCTFNVAVKDAIILQSISVYSTPDKTTYETGEALDTSGLVVKAHYSDGTSKTVTNYTLGSFDSSTAGTKTIIVSYTENGVTKTATFTVEVEEVEEPASDVGFFESLLMKIMAFFIMIIDAITSVFNSI